MSEWKPISELPEIGWYTTGKWENGKWITRTCCGEKEAAKYGYTHYLPQPAPPPAKPEDPRVVQLAEILHELLDDGPEPLRKSETGWHYMRIAREILRRFPNV